MSVAPAPSRRRAPEGSPQILLEEALAPVRGSLDEVTARLLSQLAVPIARPVEYLITAGGKRLRPALVLLAGSAGHARHHQALIDTATAVELIHTATLIHDDIIDQSPLRRAQPTFHHRWGTERAVLMGDYLYATAFTLLAHIEEPVVMHIIAQVCQELCRGELLEVDARYRLDLTEAEYLQIIHDKTASLIAGCCRSGALLGGGSPQLVERFAEFGLNFGMAFQIIDDCLDLTGQARQLGKATHEDLDKGALSLPIIYLSRRLPAPRRERLFAPLTGMSPSAARWRRTGARATDRAALARIAKAAREAGAIEQAYDRARRFLDDAQRALADTQLNGLAGAYQALAEYAISRQR